MPIKTPRLHREKKVRHLYFFRYTLPVMLSKQPEKASVYLSLKTKDFHQAKTTALLHNYHIKMSRKKLYRSNSTSTTLVNFLRST